MHPDSPARLQIVDGLVVKCSALSGALSSLVIALVATPAGALAIHAWWMGQLFFGLKVPGYGALIGLGGIVIGLFFLYDFFNHFRLKDHLLIGNDCFQQVRYGEVMVHIPFANISRLEFGEHSLLGEGVRFSLMNANDPQTIIAPWLRQRGCDWEFEIFEWNWELPLKAIHQELADRLHGRGNRGFGSMPGLNLITAHWK